MAPAQSISSMPIKFPEDDTPAKQKSILQPKPINSRLFRIRLLMLFGLLMMVLIAMKEAGNPNNWAWMGFDKSEIKLDANDLGNPDVPQPRKAGEIVVNSRPPENAASSGVSNRSNGKSISIIRQPSPVTASPNENVDYPSVAILFWREFYPRLKGDQQKRLMMIIKRLRTGEGESDAADRAFLKRLFRSRTLFDQERFDQLAMIPTDAPDKANRQEAFFKSQDIWEKSIRPAFVSAAANLDITLTQRAAITRLQTQVLDPLANEQVEDRSAIGWEGDAEAWVRMWERLNQESEPLKAKRATRIQLIGQPKLYRGRAVAVKGWVRGAQKETVSKDSRIKLNEYFVLWIRPEESKQGPYCVYTATLPDDFPEVDGNFSNLNLRVKLDGLFFKVRSFVTTENKVEYSPVILATTLATDEKENFASVAGWKPSRNFLIGMFLLIPTLAIGIAWWVFRSSETKKYTPGKKTQNKIQSGLSGLESDPQVQTDIEKVRSIADLD